MHRFGLGAVHGHDIIIPGIDIFGIDVLRKSYGRHLLARTYTGAANPYSLHETGAASAYLALQAAALGLRSSVGGFDHNKARTHFSIRAVFDIGACWAIGYLGNLDTLPENLRNGELAPRSANRVADFVLAEWKVQAHFLERSN